LHQLRAGRIDAIGWQDEPPQLDSFEATVAGHRPQLTSCKPAEGRHDVQLLERRLEAAGWAKKDRRGNACNFTSQSCLQGNILHTKT